jgi:hypothetical protein
VHLLNDFLLVELGADKPVLHAGMRLGAVLHIIVTHQEVMSQAFASFSSLPSLPLRLHTKIEEE